MKDSRAVRFLYRTVVGRMILKPLVNPSLSIFAARLFSARISARVVPSFTKKNGIDLSYYEIPANGYASFNDFFTRRMKKEYINIGHGELVSPCCGLLTVSEINKDLIFNIKNTTYSVKELLNDKELAEEFYGGTAYIFRLTPAHYHRYSFCASGSYQYKRFLQGVLHSVQPVCHEMTKVFVQNSREYTLIDNPKLGKIIQMEVGAMLVGKITNHDFRAGEEVTKGQEKGYFEYGGSSIVVLTKSNDRASNEILNREPVNGEIPVTIGETILA